MDELYGNAWGDSSNLAEDLQLPQPQWTTPKPASHDDEADLAAPSWSTGTDIRWNEPSDEHLGFKWSANEPDLAWAPESVYHTIPLQRNASTEPEREDESPLPTIHNRPENEDEEEKLRESTPIRDEIVGNGRPISAESEHTASPPTPSRSSSPDGFGTFETGLEDEPPNMSSILSQNIEGDTWSSPWVESVPSPEQKDSSVDEWEVAKRQKEQLDRKIVRFNVHQQSSMTI